MSLNNKVCSDLTFTQDNFAFFILESYDDIDTTGTMWSTNYADWGGEGDWSGTLSTMMVEEYTYSIALAEAGMEQGREFCLAIYEVNGIEDLGFEEACCQMYTFEFEDSSTRMTYAELTLAESTEDFDTEITISEEDEDGNTIVTPVAFGAEVMNFIDFKFKIGDYAEEEEEEEEEASAQALLSAWTAILATTTFVFA